MSKSRKVNNIRRPLVAFFINNYMVVLIVLNIILIIALIFLALYVIKSKKDDAKNICEDYNDIESEIEDDEIEYINNEQKNERVFVGRFVTDDEYQQMTKNRKSDISILMEEINREYEHLNEIR